MNLGQREMGGAGGWLSVLPPHAGRSKVCFLQGAFQRVTRVWARPRHRRMGVTQHFASRVPQSPFLHIFPPGLHFPSTMSAFHACVRLGFLGVGKVESCFHRSLESGVHRAGPSSRRLVAACVHLGSEH